MKFVFNSMLTAFRNTGQPERRLNVTDLALIPKRRDASWIKDFRPIILTCSGTRYCKKL